MTEIRDNILCGTWSRGFQLPGEVDLARGLGVSVITVRQALGQLAQEGLVRRERAKGTFVSWSGPVNQAINLGIEVENLVTLNPEGTSFKLLGTESIEPGAELQRDFKLSRKQKITRMTRIRMAQGRPLAYVYSYVPARVADKVSPKSLLKLPLSSAIESGLGSKSPTSSIWSERSWSTTRSRPIWRFLRAHPRAFVERNYLCKKELVLRTVGFYRSDLFRYELKLRRGSVKPT